MFGKISHLTSGYFVVMPINVLSLQDSSKNPDEFPKSFIRGTLEGIWWTFVTMTTVG